MGTKLLFLLLALAVQEKPSEIRLLVRADDMGVALGVNEACIRSCKDGIARSVEVIVPGPWFLDAVQRLQANPDIDVGVHLCLTSEWERVKWKPLTASPSLADKEGYFFPMTRQRKDFPPGTGLFDQNPRPEEIERELRTQIETLKRHVPRLSHASAHMGAATATPEARAITEKLCKEFGLRLEAKGTRPVRSWSGSQKSGEQKEADLAAALEKLEPGTWLIVEHPGVDTEEMRAMGHQGYENVAADRAGVTRAFTSERVKEVIKVRGVKLISHLDLPTESDSGYSFSAKLGPVLQAGSFTGKALITTDVNPQWMVEFEVLKTIHGTPPAAPGGRVTYVIHSPARTLGNDPPAGAEFIVSGELIPEKDGSGRHRITVRRP
jgi:predicted glycoside hydrolase/deacetylase ChbG (UPF0249 family)